MPHFLQRLDTYASHFFKVFCKICDGIATLIGIMFMLALQTVLKWFSVSILWSDEVVSVMNIWLIFTAATVVEHEKKHVKVDFVTNYMPAWMQQILECLVYLLIISACFFVFRGGVAYLQQTRNITTNMLGLPMFGIYSAPLLAIALMALMNLWHLLRMLAELFFRHSKCGEEERV